MNGLRYLPLPFRGGNGKKPERLAMEDAEGSYRARVFTMPQLVHAATHDALTDLPNRALFLDRLDQALRHARRSGCGFGVGFLDVDRFKAVNDSLGHAAGDEVLCALARRLVGAVRTEDTIARLGGDEFGLLFPGTSDRAGTRHVLAKLVAVASQPLTFAAAEIRVSVSIGACLWCDPCDEARSLLADADQTMYRVKHAGGNDFHLNEEQWHG